MKNFFFGMQGIAFLLFTGCLLLSSCKKDDDPTPTIIGSWDITSVTTVDTLECGPNVIANGQPCTIDDEVGCQSAELIFNADSTYTLTNIFVGLDDNGDKFLGEDVEAGTFEDSGTTIVFCEESEPCDDPQGYTLSDNGNTSTVIDDSDPDCVLTAIFKRR